MANSVLPLPPQLGDSSILVHSRPASFASIIPELTAFLKENPPITQVSWEFYLQLNSMVISLLKIRLKTTRKRNRTLLLLLWNWSFWSIPIAAWFSIEIDWPPFQSTSNLMDAMSKSMEDMTNSTYLKYKQRSLTVRRPQTLFLFVSSIARTNLEIEVVQRGGSLLAHSQPNPLIPKRSCIGKIHRVGYFEKLYELETEGTNSSTCGFNSVIFVVVLGVESLQLSSSTTFGTQRLQVRCRVSQQCLRSLYKFLLSLLQCRYSTYWLSTLAFWRIGLRGRPGSSWHAWTPSLLRVERLGNSWWYPLSKTRFHYYSWIRQHFLRNSSCFFLSIWIKVSEYFSFQLLLWQKHFSM